MSPMSVSVGVGGGILPLAVDNHQAIARVGEIVAEYTRLLGDWREPLEEAARVIYEHEQEWFDSRGRGSWAPLKPETVAAKHAGGYPYPSKPLYRTGALYESATSQHGPYSILEIGPDQLKVGVDWEPWRFHHDGTETLPARPIFVMTPDLVRRLVAALEDRLRTARKVN